MLRKTLSDLGAQCEAETEGVKTELIYKVYKFKVPPDKPRASAVG